MSYNIIIAQEKEKDKLSYFLNFFLILATNSSAISIIAIMKSMNIIIGSISSLIKKNENSIMFNIIILLPFLVVH